MQQSETRGHNKRNTKLLKVLFLFLACLFMVFSGAGCEREIATAAIVDVPQNEGAKTSDGKAEEEEVLVTYFHTDFRCPTCKLLEEYSRETVERDFADEMKQGKVTFRVINVDESENKHFVKDYSLFTKSLVVSLNKNGKEVRWKNLPDIWKHVRNRGKFDQYVKGKIESFLKDL